VPQYVLRHQAALTGLLAADLITMAQKRTLSHFDTRYDFLPAGHRCDALFGCLCFVIISKWVTIRVLDLCYLICMFLHPMQRDGQDFRLPRPPTLLHTCVPLAVPSFTPGCPSLLCKSYPV